MERVLGTLMECVTNCNGQDGIENCIEFVFAFVGLHGKLIPHSYRNDTLAKPSVKIEPYVDQQMQNQSNK